MNEYDLKVNTNCIEIVSTRAGIDEGKLLGYVVFFGGGWDGWGVSPYDCQSMRRVRSNVSSFQIAIEAVVHFAFSYGMNRVTA